MAFPPKPSGTVLPPHKYIPGQTPRHPEGWFDFISDTATAGMGPEELAASPAFQAGRLYYDHGYYWECHEVLEAVWLACPEGSDARIMVQALIQLANAQLKADMKRPNAVRRLCAIVRDVLAALEGRSAMGMSPAWLLQQVGELEDAI